MARESVLKLLPGGKAALTSTGSGAEGGNDSLSPFLLTVIVLIVGGYIYYEYRKRNPARIGE